MGKLHELRKDIERNPRKWMFHDQWFPGCPYRAYPARQLSKRSWMPIERTVGSHHPYQAFVVSVLRELGYSVR